MHWDLGCRDPVDMSANNTKTPTSVLIAGLPKGRKTHSTLFYVKSIVPRPQFDSSAVIRLKRPQRARPATAGLQWAISSSARLVVRGPKTPIVAITIAIAAAMKAKTPGAPRASSTKAMMKELKITESRLQE